ncbi:MAG: radical SAM protein [Saccharolobus sp.]
MSNAKVEPISELPETTKKILTELGFHVLDQSEQFVVVYHAPTVSLWKVEPEDFKNPEKLIEKLVEKINGKIHVISHKWKNCRFTPTEKITLLISTTCNMKCRYCYANGNFGLKEEIMLPENAVKYIEKVRKCFGEIKMLQFFGGEPLLSFATIKTVVEYLNNTSRNNVHYIVNTNGTIMNEDIAKYLCENFAEIFISVDGPPHIHDKNRIFKNNEGTWEKICMNLKILQKARKDRKCKIIAEATYTKIAFENGFTPLDILKYLTSELGFDDAYVVPEWHKEKTFQDEDKLTEEYFDVVRYRYNSLTSTELFSHFSPENCKFHFCTAGLSTITITPPGDVYPCFWLIDEKFRMGNVNGDFPSKEFFDIQQLFWSNGKELNKKCSHCVLVNTCTQCLGKRFARFGNITDTINEECERSKNIFQKFALLLGNEGEKHENNPERSI